jgi:hypothetical protein
MQTSMMIEAVLQNEAGVFLLFGIAFVLFVLGFCWVLREWSWIPRKRQRREFVERF